MKLLSVQVGMPKKMGVLGSVDPMDRPWESGFYKDPVHGTVTVESSGLTGDGQADLENHGGPDKAINVYPSEHFSFWKQSLGLDCLPGAFGENFTTAEFGEEDVHIGDVFMVGDITVQVTQPRQPCWKLARRWRVKDLAVQVQKTGRTGWYFRVLEGGSIEAPEEFLLIDRPHPEWTIARANRVMHDRNIEPSTVLALSACKALSASWKNTLRMRAEKQIIIDDAPRLHGEDNQMES